MPDSDAVPRFADALRTAYPKVLARVLSRASCLADAEDAVQEALLRALDAEAKGQRPEAPVPWLTRVAINCLHDGLRGRSRQARHQTALEWLSDAGAAYPTEVAWDDELLGLIVTACDPALSLAERCALTLATVAGMTSAEIARAFLVAPRAMEQRITRAKRRLGERRQAFEPAGPGALKGRLPAVLAAVHLIFNEGYWSAGETPIRRDMARLALGLARSIERLVPDDAEVAGLLSLLLLHEARAESRLSDAGDVLSLPEQDRTLWHSATIDEACALLRDALSKGQPGPFQLEAAVAAVHCSAARAEDTDWLQIAMLYEQLERLRPSPVVVVNRAFAVGQALGPADGLALLATVAARPELQAYPYYPLVLGALREAAGDVEGARSAFTRALCLCVNDAERVRVQGRIARLADT